MTRKAYDPSALVTSITEEGTTFHFLNVHTITVLLENGDEITISPKAGNRITTTTVEQIVEGIRELETVTKDIAKQLQMGQNKATQELIRVTNSEIIDMFHEIGMEPPPKK